MLATPIGYTAIKAALDLARAKLPAAADAEREVAEACHSGKIAAAYRAWDGGADPLDPRIWQRPHWRSLFELGTVTLDLPLIDDRGRPSADGRIAPRCVREVFVSSENLFAFLSAIPASARDAPMMAKRGPKASKLKGAISAMKQDLLSERLTVDQLSTLIEKDLAARYGVSRDTARKARIEAITGGVSKLRKK